MRSPLNNPFQPGSDQVPAVWAGRQELLADWRDRVRPRRAAGEYERGRTVLGEPGIGKSVLVRRLAEEARRAGDWVTPQLRIPRGDNPLRLLADATLDLADLAGLPARREQPIAGLLERVRTVSLGGVAVGIEPADGVPAHAALTRLLVEVGRAAASEGNVVLMHLDEVQNVVDDDARSQLLVALGDALAHAEAVEVPGGHLPVLLPLSIYLTGLPEFADLASSRQGATFARRFATTVLAPIDDDDLRLALLPFVRDGWPVVSEGDAQRIWMTPDAARRIVELCHGDPFLFQLAGQQAWDADAASLLDNRDVEVGWSRARSEARAHVERLLARLPEKERLMIDVMAQLPAEDRTLTNIAKEMGYAQASQAGPTAQRLDTVRGIVERRGRSAPYVFRSRIVEAYLVTDWP
jgi:hypothetical protein